MGISGLSRTPAEYRWTSYDEYVKSKSLVDVELVLGMITKEQFIDLHKDVSNDEVLDIREEHFRITDAEAIKIVKEVSRVGDISEFARLEISAHNSYIKELRKKRLSIRQISRVTGVCKGSIERIK
jgi:DNA-binding MltR family transcriptional regulator